MEINSLPKVCVLLSTYNGEEFLRKQLDSILNQKDVEVHLVARDDGSSDSTVDILKEYDAKYQFDKIIVGSNVGWRCSFSTLVLNADDYDYYAFSDQDDVWNERKLITAINMMNKEDQSIPLLYESAFDIIDENDIVTDSKCASKKDLVDYNFFKLLHEYKTNGMKKGCLQVFNFITMQCFKKTVESCIDIWPEHDKLIDEIVFLFGKFIYDDKFKSIQYRIHQNNATYVFSFNPKVFFNFCKKFTQKFIKHLKSHYYSNNLTVLTYSIINDIIDDELKQFVVNGSMYLKDKNCKKALLKSKLWKQIPLYWRVAHKVLIRKGWY